MPSIVLEYLVRRHLSDRHSDSGVHEVDDLPAPDEIHQGDDDKPDQQAAAADHEGIFETYDIPKTKDGCAGVDFQEDLGLVGHGPAYAHHCGADGV